MKRLIGIGGILTASPLPHHRAYGSRITAVRLVKLSGVYSQPDFQIRLPKFDSYPYGLATFLCSLFPPGFPAVPRYLIHTCGTADGGLRSHVPARPVGE